MHTTRPILVLLFLFALISSCQKEFKDDGDDIPNAYDTDARKFIDSSGITDITGQTAIDNLVKQLKDSSLWTKFAAIYPMVGGTPATTKWNLKDPRDLDVAYRLTFHGAPVYTDSGVLFPTMSDYADTHLTDATLNYNDNSISYYSATQNTVSGYDMGCDDHAAPYNEMAIFDIGDASVWFGYSDFSPEPVITKGLFMLSATASNVTRYENGLVKKSRGAAPSMGSTGYPILIGIVAHAIYGGNRVCALATIGNGLTDAQAFTFYKIVQNFETSLGR